VPTEEPLVGQIVEHYFLWNREKVGGLGEGAKPRPCLIIAVERIAADKRVTLLPITSRPPELGAAALTIPDGLKSRIGIDPARQSWLILDEANVFTWPGFDLVPQASGRFARGIVTSGFFRQVVDAVLAVRARGGSRDVDRDF
jgi:hypothetical protein